MKIDLRLWNKLDTLSQAALLLHEELYLYERGDLGIKDSLRARSMVAQVLARSGTVSAWADRESYPYKCIARNDALKRSGHTEFFVNISNRSDGKKILAFQFVSLEGQKLLTLTKARFYGLDLEISNIQFGLETTNEHPVVSGDAMIASDFIDNRKVRLITTPGESSRLVFYDKNERTSELQITGCFSN